MHINVEALVIAVAMPASALWELVAGTHDFSEPNVLSTTKFVPWKPASNYEL